jgi:uncharacterized protein (DUF305 family)
MNKRQEMVMQDRTRAHGSAARLRNTALLGLLLIAMQAAIPADLPDQKFLAEMNHSMMRMHSAMAVSPSGDIDADFVAMMVPHHQGAIDMAQAELRYGHNEQLRRIAQEIIVTQQAEIAAMRLAVGEPLPPQAPAPDQQSSTTGDNAKFSYR